MKLMRSANNKSKFRFEYVKSFEQANTFLPNTYFVVRIDGRCFHQSVLCKKTLRLCLIPDFSNLRLSLKYNFKKPNDRSALELMNACAIEVMNEFPDIVLGYGMSDEFR